jgi:5-methylcytosine-specific restriction endonuclease McrA
MGKFRLRKPSAQVRGILQTNKHRNWVKTRAKMQGDRCFYCGEPLGDDRTLDHYIPLSRGGADEFDNTRAAHRQCNRDKGNTLPEELMLTKPQ